MPDAASRPAASGNSRHDRAGQNAANGVRTVLYYRNLLAGVGLQHLLAETDFAEASIASDEASLALCCATNPPDLVVLDGAFSGPVTETAKCLKDRHPEVRVVVVAERFDLDFVRAGSEAGIDGFCPSASGRDVLIRSLELVMLGEPALPGAVARALLSGDPAIRQEQPQESRIEPAPERPDPGVRRLSVRESEILRCLTRGDSNKVIARQFDVAEATVKVHVKAILRKIGLANRTQAAMWAVAQMSMQAEALSGYGAAQA